MTPPEKVAAITELIAAGHSIRAVARELGCSKTTIARYHASMFGKICGCGAPSGHAWSCFYHKRTSQLATPPLCPCGRPATHRGRCVHRRAMKKNHDCERVACEVEYKLNQVAAPEAKPLADASPDEPTPEPFSMFAGLPKFTPRRNKPWRRVDG